VITGTVESDYREWLREFHAPAQGRRTAERNAAFFLPHLRPEFSLLDAGCGGGSITVGLAKTVGSGKVVGVDISDEAVKTARFRATEDSVSNVEFRVADAAKLDFGDATFDGVFCHALLQHVDSPLNVLRELKRVLKPGGTIGVADADFDASVTSPMNDVLRNSIEIVRRTRRHPTIGRDLRSLLNAAGLSCVVGSAVARSIGSGPPVKLEGEFYFRYFSAEPLIRYAEESGWASRADMAEMAQAWRDWGDDPGAFSASLWLQAVARAPQTT